MTIQTMDLVGLQAHPHLENSTAYRQLRPTRRDSNLDAHSRANHMVSVCLPFYSAIAHEDLMRLSKLPRTRRDATERIYMPPAHQYDESVHRPDKAPIRSWNCLYRSDTPAARAALYRTVPGIGPLTAATLVAHLPELGHWDSKALTSLVGLAPWSRDSGKKRGHRAIRGGRGLVRRALYMCAWAVILHDSEVRRFYDRIRHRGKPGNVAVVAVMRKILFQLNVVARRGTPWVPQAG